MSTEQCRNCGLMGEHDCPDAPSLGGAPPKELLVPGVMRCAKCNFQLTRTNLYVNSGTAGPGNSKTEPCPNGCGPLWPVTWQEWANQGWKAVEEMFEEKRELESSNSALRQQLEEAQAKVDVAEGKLEISLNANHILKQRLDDAEGQEPVAWTAREWLGERNIRGVTKLHPSFPLPLYLRPIPPAADARVKELIESLSLALTGHMIGHDKSDGNKYSDGFVAGFRSCVEAAKRVDAALAASKGEKAP